jgi:iron complex outermembrane receptor protein
LFDIGGFIFSKKEINKFTLSGGLRFDSRSLSSKEFEETGTVKFPGFKRNYFNISGSAGFSYEISGEVVVKLNVAKGFRAPSIPELASNGAHEGTNRFEYGEQDLRSETSFQLDGGIEVNTEHLSLTGNLFYNSINNFIYYRKLQASGGGDSIILDGTQEFAAFRFDQHNAKLLGGEFIMDIHPHPLDWLHIENAFSYVRGMLNQETDGSKNLPFIPAAKLRSEIRADFKQVAKTFRNAYLKIEVDNTFSQNKPFTGFNTETKSPGYSLLNAGFGGDLIRKGITIFSIFIAGNNLTDVAYQSHLSRLKYLALNASTGRTGVYNMGRNFSIKLNIPLSFPIGM